MRKPRKRTYDYVMPDMAKEAATDDRGAAMAFFLLENTGTVLGRWRGYMHAADQRLLFGRAIGKGTIVLDGDDETVSHVVSMCFGTIYDTNWGLSWVKLL